MVCFVFLIKVQKITPPIAHRTSIINSKKGDTKYTTSMYTYNSFCFLKFKHIARLNTDNTAISKKNWRKKYHLNKSIFWATYWSRQERRTFRAMKLLVYQRLCFAYIMIHNIYNIYFKAISHIIRRHLEHPYIQYIHLSIFFFRNSYEYLYKWNNLINFVWVSKTGVFDYKCRSKDFPFNTRHTHWACHNETSWIWIRDNAHYDEIQNLHFWKMHRHWFLIYTMIEVKRKVESLKIKLMAVRWNLTGTRDYGDFRNCASQ
jgi:hypothetical protein